ncbi:MAG TPA: hypothetical protein P5567_09275 [Kiritimatiellia bacterium]|nr:hypothetical protein [Kiritimatiellia bacterium]HRZ12633.1 hypothetical protein [Kiritimatiellia bacterium]HSA17711.1 hypothetical protein [Kiritimatiellia bacterium]
MKSRLPIVVLLPVLFCLPALAEIQSRAVEYRAGDAVMEGYLAWDDPVRGAAYNEKADRRSWRAMRNFLEETLGR